MPEIEYATLANHAEAINGLLYLQGAGWTDIFQNVDQQGQPAIVHFGIAVSLLIGWNETNRRYPLALEITHEDGEVLMAVNAQVEAGRPPGIPSGSDIRSVLAIGADAQFPRAGGYALIARLGESEAGDRSEKIVSFRVRRP